MQSKSQRINKCNRNGIYLIKDANEFLTVMEQLQKEYNNKNNGEKNNGRFKH